ncbi:MAG TPA: hypothetical protein VGR03_09775 [Candidatus Acidoferrum sp.]|nr:hypothetical protein [Candidatus Acidoferrum sp.]
MEKMGMRSFYYSRALREAVFFLWERQKGSKLHCAEFRSKAAAGLRFGKGRLVYDHAIPFNYLQNELLHLPEGFPTDLLRDTLNKFCRVALITRQENDRLQAAAYQSKIPGDWDGIDHLARYKAVGGIEIEKNTFARARQRLDQSVRAGNRSE